ncbi:hypothetical protein [Streptomyces sp. NPDC051079]|uniref:hypothetical protein n=1 Tax=Streptomyces sp. NPDC051079 TaxID=3155043 RepID=UPI00344C89BE
MTTLDEQSVKRLAYIRMLYEQGVAHAKQPLPMGATSVLSLHDSVEMFLVLSCDVLNVPWDKNTQFLEYWKKLKDVPLTGQHGMRRLNDARNGLKHSGGLPSPEIIEQALTDAFSFFDDNVPRVFGAALWSVDTSYAIPQETVRRWVRRATDRFDKGEGGAALALLQRALLEVLEEQNWPYGTLMGRISGPRHRMHSIGTLLREALNGNRSIHLGDAARQLDGLEKDISALQDGFRWIVLGGNLHHYARFQALAPRHLYWGGADEGEALESILARPDVASRRPNREEFEFCRQFVVTTALRRADIEAHVAPPSWEPKR